jgi:quercetin dioxygenase-like cupin family protein
MAPVWLLKSGKQPQASARGAVRNGIVGDGKGVLTLAAIGESGMVVHLALDKGYLQPGHSHPHHEALGFVISGRLRMVVAGSDAVLEPGDGWHHPKGSWHITEALEDSTAIEVHVPIRDDILKRMGVDIPTQTT